MNTTVVSEAVASTLGLNAMEKLRSSLLSTVWIMLIAIPGYWIAIFSVDCCGRKRLQRLGFLATAVTFLVLGLAYNTPLRYGGNGGGFVFLYGLTYLFSNAGPNSVTFLMPAEAFPVSAPFVLRPDGTESPLLPAHTHTHSPFAFCARLTTPPPHPTPPPQTLVRATAHGLSAASGKIGATVGAYGLLDLFYRFPSADSGVVAVMLVCAAVALLGAAMNEFFCKETGGVSLEEVDSGLQKFAPQSKREEGGQGSNFCSRTPRANSEGGEDVSTPLSPRTAKRVEYGSLPWPEP
jgi:PHS family inorganic phosphate transporter-like MFS transporter